MFNEIIQCMSLNFNMSSEEINEIYIDIQLQLKIGEQLNLPFGNRNVNILM